MGLHRRGKTAAEIHEMTKCPLRSIGAYIAEYEIGTRTGRFEDYFGKDFGSKDICRLHGIADRR